MTFVEFVQWLATSGALGAVSYFLLQCIKALFPSVKDKVASIASVLMAAIVGIVATFAVPYLNNLPPWIDQVWPIIVWLWSQLFYEIMK